MVKIPSTFPVTSHTDFVGEGSTFVAIHGMKEHGSKYISLALERGATVIVIEKTLVLSHELELLLKKKKAKLARVDNGRKALAQLSAHALDFPAKKLKIIGITGTKGKTTSAFMTAHILTAAGYKTALLSTVYNKIVNQILPTTLTTQQPDYLHVFFDQCLKAGVDYVVMEVAAQAFTLHRVDGIPFCAFLFTNFDREHAEFYTTQEDYFHAKSSLLLQCAPDAPLIVNKDMERCKELLQKHEHCLTFGKNITAMYQFKKISSTKHSSHLNIKTPTGLFEVVTSLIGNFNSYNVAGVFALCYALKLDPQNIVSAIKTFHKVPGRLERYELPNNALCFIDYAHNPSSYQSVLSTLRTLTDHLIVVCGAGGDRDKGKRPVMGALATKFADQVIFTSDNPRSEDPADIIQEMVAGVAGHHSGKVITELDREQAIKKAYKTSKAGSIIALLGKGPDHYQIVADKKVYFNEAEILQNITNNS